MKHEMNIESNIIRLPAKGYGIIENIYDDEVLIVAAARQRIRIDFSSIIAITIVATTTTCMFFMNTISSNQIQD